MTWQKRITHSNGLMPAITPLHPSNTLLHLLQSLFIQTTSTLSDSKQMFPTSPQAPSSHKKCLKMDGTWLLIYPNHSMRQKGTMTSLTKNSLPLSTPSIIGECIWKEHAGHLKYGPITKTFYISQLPEPSPTDKPDGHSFYHALILYSCTNLE